MLGVPLATPVREVLLLSTQLVQSPSELFDLLLLVSNPQVALAVLVVLMIPLVVVAFLVVAMVEDSLAVLAPLLVFLDRVSLALPPSGPLVVLAKDLTTTPAAACLAIPSHRATITAQTTTPNNTTYQVHGQGIRI